MIMSKESHKIVNNVSQLRGELNENINYRSTDKHTQLH